MLPYGSSAYTAAEKVLPAVTCAGLSPMTRWFAGARTVTRNDVSLWLPAASVAVTSTGVVPGANREPDGGE